MIHATTPTRLVLQLVAFALLALYLSCDSSATESTEADTIQAAIERNRMGDLTIAVTGPDGSPLPGMRVQWRLAERSFHFGFIEEPYNPAVVSMMRDAGCDFVTGHFLWSRTEPGDDVFPWMQIDFRSGPAAHSEAGLVFKAHAVLWWLEEALPRYLDELSFAQMREEVAEHVRELVRHYRDDIDIWNVINEPSANWVNHYGYTNAQIIELIKVATAVIRREDPSARIIINSALPADGNYGNQQYPLEFLRECEAAGVDYDIVGLQVYYDPYARRYGVGPVSLEELGAMVDAYSQIGKEIHITELSVPSAPIQHSPSWTPELQADWLEATYQLFFSKPQVGAITWWNATDRYSYVDHGGLIDAGGRPKPSYDRLRTLLTRRWFTEGRGTTGADGRVTFRGYGGYYDVTISDPDGDDSLEMRMLVRERRSRMRRVRFDPRRIAGIRSRAERRTGKLVEERLTWLRRLIEHRDAQGERDMANQGRLGAEAVEEHLAAGNVDRALTRVQAVLDGIAIEKTTVVRAVEMSEAGGSLLDLSGSFAGFHSVAALKTNLKLQSRRATVMVRASGDFAGPDPPAFVLSLGSENSGEVFLTQPGWRIYSLEFEYEPGRHELRIHYPNDYFENNADRNLYIDTITVVEKSWQAPQ